MRKINGRAEIVIMSSRKIIFLIFLDTCDIVGATPSKPVVSIRSDSGNQVWLVCRRFAVDVVCFYGESIIIKIWLPILVWLVCIVREWFCKSLKILIAITLVATIMTKGWPISMRTPPIKTSENLVLPWSKWSYTKKRMRGWCWNCSQWLCQWRWWWRWWWPPLSQFQGLWAELLTNELSLPVSTSARQSSHTTKGHQEARKYDQNQTVWNRSSFETANHL